MPPATPSKQRPSTVASQLVDNLELIAKAPKFNMGDFGAAAMNISKQMTYIFKPHALYSYKNKGFTTYTTHGLQADGSYAIIKTDGNMNMQSPVLKAVQSATKEKGFVAISGLK
jgi:hypothetical protein